MSIGALAAGLGASLLKKGAKIPKYKKVDQDAEQKAAIAGNLASFDSAKELADKTSMADQERLESIISRTLPDYQNILRSAGGAISNMIAGNLPMADQGMTIRRAAERGGAMGLGGSQAGRNLTARDLGIGQVQLISQGLNAFNSFSSNLRQNYTVNPMSQTSMYMTPQQRTDFAMRDNQFSYNAAVGRAQSNAANNPFNRAMNFVGGAAGLYLGNNGFGGGGQQQSGGFFQRMRSGIGSLFGNTSSAPTSPNQSGGYYNAPRPLT
jgi:hypothetical protein